MTEAEAEDWLSVAAGAVIEYPAIHLREAARLAQRVCTHHAQIVPEIVKQCDASVQFRDPFSWAKHPPLLIEADLPQLPPPQITQDMVDAMSPELIRMGLKCGALVRDGDGNVVVSPE